MRKVKKALCLLVSSLMFLSVFQLTALSAFADESNPYWIKAGADISSSKLTASNAGTLVQNNDSSEIEQLTIKASGKTLSISGKTSLAPLPKKEGYTPIYVTSFKNLSTNSFGKPYIAMMPTKHKSADGSVYYTFSGEYDFSDVANGNYKMYLWRGYKEENRNYYYMGSSLSKIDSNLNPGILHYANVINVKNNSIEVVEYDAIVSANTAAYNKMNTYSPNRFLDKSLKDIDFANKDPRKASASYAPLSSAEIDYISSVAASITKNSTTDYDKVKSIYEYVAGNFYYDDKRPGNSGSNSAYSNPYVNLKGFNDKSTNNYNIYNGKVATNCVGYNAMVAALSRAVGIPTRIVSGVHITDTSWATQKDLNTENHHWAECYVDGKWIMVDANMGNQNHYTGKTWTKTGLSNYAFFDPTIDEISTNYIVKGVYLALDTPTLKAVVNDDGSFTLSWNKIPDAEKYEVYSKQSDGSYVMTKSTSDTSFTTVPATYGKKFTYRVRALNSDTTSAYSKDVSVTNIKLAAPVMKAAVNENGSFTLSWRPVTGAEKYELYSKQADGSYKLLKTTSGTSYTTAVADYGKSFTYKVRAVNGNIKSAYSAEVTATNNKVEKPKVTVSNSSSGKPRLTWEKVDGAVKYEIYRSGYSNGTYKKMYTTTGTSYTNTSAGAGYTYFYRVQALDKNGKVITKSDVVKQVCKLEKPVITKGNSGAGKPMLTWEAVPGAVKYEIYRSGYSNGTYKKMYTTTKTSYTNTSAGAGYTYFYKVVAVSKSNQNANATSEIVKQKCLAEGLAVTKGNASSGKPRLTWKKVDGATKYEIYRSGYSNGTYKKMYTTTSASYTNTSATKGYTYFYKVKAIGPDNFVESSIISVKCR
ncbi:MAG: GH85 family endohexosaminidase C-terminal domain-containing protein [Emergencia sp.]